MRMKNSIHLNKGEIQMSEKNKAILEKGNAAIAEGNNEGLLLSKPKSTNHIDVLIFINPK
jgi:hypothetical protein